MPALLRFWLAVLTVGSLLSEQSVANVACEPQADTKYESAFCRIKQSSDGKGLPSLADFRRNSQQMQYLLLRRPAGKLGISLSPPAERVLLTPTVKQSIDRPEQPQPQPRRHLDTPSVSATCRTAINYIRCGRRTFKRLQNRSNKQIRPTALDASNRLLLDPIDSEDNEAAYLLAAYVQYLYKMDSIGLAGSTSSYSAFAHTFYEHQRSGTDFVERFRTLFEVLKQDKKTIGISQRKLAQPPAWRDCETLNSELIACYSQRMNLVYRAAR